MSDILIIILTPLIPSFQQQDVGGPGLDRHVDGVDVDSAVTRHGPRRQEGVAPRQGHQRNTGHGENISKSSRTRRNGQIFSRF